jgi:hypothetical protein
MPPSYGRGTGMQMTTGRSRQRKKERDRAGFMSHMIALWGDSTVAAEESVA